MSNANRLSGTLKPIRYVLFAARSVAYVWYQTSSSLMEPSTQLGPTRIHRSVVGVAVRVKSGLGDALTGSLNTFWSIPKFVTETVGFIHKGPIRTRTFAGSGPPSGDCADAGRAVADTTAMTPAKQAIREKEQRG